MPANETGLGSSGVATTEFVTSKDGTRIAFDRTGDGPPVIMVAGAIGNRSFGDQLGPLLSDFTVFNYDHRGRNESGDTLPYAVEREIEDVEALINEAGVPAFVYGISSGAVLALEAAASGLAITKLALYEPPLLVDDSRPPVPDDYLKQINEAVSAGRRGDALEIFMTKAVGMPAEFVAGMRNEPMWPGLEAIAHTIAYDGAIMEGLMFGKPLPPERAGRWSSITAPTLVLVGGATWPFMHTGAEALSDVLPNAQHRTLEGQTHDVNAAVLAPALVEFFQA